MTKTLATERGRNRKILFVRSLIVFCFLNQLCISGSIFNFFFPLLSKILFVRLGVCLEGRKSGMKEWDREISERFFYFWLFGRR